MHGWMDGCMDAWMYGCMDGWMGGWIGGWMDGWMDRWVDGCMDAWMDGWRDRRIVFMSTVYYVCVIWGKPFVLLVSCVNLLASIFLPFQLIVRYACLGRYARVSG